MNEPTTNGAGQHESIKRRFRVRVGHAAITVEGRDRHEAIQRARRTLGTQLPRLWDVIYRMEDAGFEVDELH